MTGELDLADLRARVTSLETDNAQLRVRVDALESMSRPAPSASQSTGASPVPMPVLAPASAPAPAQPALPQPAGWLPPPPQAPNPETHLATPVAAAPSPPAGVSPSVGVPSPVGAPSPIGAPPTTGAPITVESLLRIGGALLVGLAALFLISTAISQGYVTPPLQLLGAAVLGVGTMGAGLRLQHQEPWGSTLAIVGSAIVTAAATAGHGWLALYGPEIGLVLTSLATAASAALAARLHNQWVATAASLTLLVLPAWAGIIDASPVAAVGLWLALFLLAVNAFGLGQRWGWYRLISSWSAAFWLLALLAVLEPTGSTRFLAGALVGLTTAILWGNPLFSNWDLGRNRPTTVGTFPGWERASVVAVPLWTWIAVLTVIRPDQSVGNAVVEGGYGLALAAGFTASAVATRFVAGHLSRLVIPLQLLGAVTLSGVAALAWLGGSAEPVVFLSLGLASFLASRSLNHDRPLRVAAALSAAIGTLGMMEELIALANAANLGGATVEALSVALGLGVATIGTATIRRWEAPAVAEWSHAYLAAGLSALAWAATAHVPDQFLSESFLVLAVALGGALWLAATYLGKPVNWVALANGTIALLLTAGLLVASIQEPTDTTLTERLAVLAAIAAAAGVTWRLWPNESWRNPVFLTTWVVGFAWVLAVFLPYDEGQVGVSVLWAAAAVGAIWIGGQQADPVIRNVGLTSLAVVVVKLLTVDLAEVDTLWRVLLFLVIGGGMLRLAYMLPALERRAGAEPPSLSGGDQP